MSSQLKQTPIRFGNINAVCQLCNNTRHRFGTLVDPGGHVWLICADCIKSMWDKNHWQHIQDLVEERAEEMAMTKIRESLFGSGRSGL